MPEVQGRLFPGDVAGVYRPIIDVDVQLGNGRKFGYPAIVDSGADDTTFPATVLEAYKMP